MKTTHFDELLAWLYAILALYVVSGVLLYAGQIVLSVIFVVLAVCASCSFCMVAHCYLLLWSKS